MISKVPTNSYELFWVSVIYVKHSSCGNPSLSPQGNVSMNSDNVRKMPSPEKMFNKSPLIVVPHGFCILEFTDWFCILFSLLVTTALLWQ